MYVNPNLFEGGELIGKKQNFIWRQIDMESLTLHPGVIYWEGRDRSCPLAPTPFEIDTTDFSVSLWHRVGSTASVCINTSENQVTSREDGLEGEGSSRSLC